MFTCSVFFQLHESSYVPNASVDLQSRGEAIAGVLEHCDVACLLYDTSDSTSFQTAAQLFVR